MVHHQWFPILVHHLAVSKPALKLRRRHLTLLFSGQIAVFVIFKVAVLLQAKFFIELFSRI